MRPGLWQWLLLPLSTYFLLISQTVAAPPAGVLTHNQPQLIQPINKRQDRSCQGPFYWENPACQNSIPGPKVLDVDDPPPVLTPIVFNPSPSSSSLASSSLAPPPPPNAPDQVSSQPPAVKPPLPVAGPPLNITTQTYDKVINWGTANPWDAIAQLNALGGPCTVPNGGCSEAEDLKFPTTVVNKDTGGPKLAGDSSNISISIKASSFTRPSERDALIVAMLNLLHQGNKVEERNTRILPNHHDPIAQNFNTNEMYVYMTNASIPLVQVAFMHVVVELQDSSDGYCKQLEEGLGVAEGFLFILSLIPGLQELLPVEFSLIGVSTELIATCNNPGMAPGLGG